MTDEDYQEAFNERAAIIEYDAGLPRAEAEYRARRCLDPTINPAKDAIAEARRILKVDKM